MASVEVVFFLECDGSTYASGTVIISGSRIRLGRVVAEDQHLLVAVVGGPVNDFSTNVGIQVVDEVDYKVHQ